MNRHLDPAVGSFWYSAYTNVKDIKKTGANEVTVTTKVPDALFNEFTVGCPGRHRIGSNPQEGRRRLRKLHRRRELHRPV